MYAIGLVFVSWVVGQMPIRVVSRICRAYAFVILSPSCWIVSSRVIGMRCENGVLWKTAQP